MGCAMITSAGDLRPLEEAVMGVIDLSCDVLTVLVVYGAIVGVLLLCDVRHTPEDHQ